MMEVMMNSKTYIALIVIIILATTMAGCQKKEIVEKEEVRVPVTVMKPVSGTVVKNYRTTGTVLAGDESLLSFPGGGRLTQMYVDVGDVVEAGQLLAKVDAVQYQKTLTAATAAYDASIDGVKALEAALDVTKNQLADANNRFDKVEADYLRFEALYEDEVITKKEFEDIETAYESARLGVQSAEDGLRASELQVEVARGQSDAAAAQKAQASKSLSDAVLKAPYAGIITERMMQIGEIPGRGDSVFRLTGEGIRRVRLEIPEENHGKIVVGDTVNISLEYLPDETITAEVSKVTPDVNRGSRTFIVEIVIPEEYDVMPGSFCKAELVLETAEQAMTLPIMAILSFEGDRQGVYVSEDGEAKRVFVTLGLIEADKVQIVDGLTWDDEVVITGNKFLNEGAKLDVQTGSDE